MVKVGDIVEILKDRANSAPVVKGQRFTVKSVYNRDSITVTPGAWAFESGNYEVVSPDWIGPPLTPEEDGVTSTIHTHTSTDSVHDPIGAFKRAIDERNEKGYDPFETKVAGLFEEARLSLLSKHHDYGPLNIARSPGGPLNGLRVRLWDKLARLNHLVDSGAEPENESLEDTFRDIVGYGAIGLLVLRGDWPDE